jgi:hypothetical protein
MIHDLIKIVLLFIVLVTISACEDVIEVNLETAKPRLVIDAAIHWKKNTSGNIQTIRLTTTTSFYTIEVPVATGAIITVFDGKTTFNFIEETNTGNYICSNFNPIINNTYVLSVKYNGQTYTATEKLIATPIIEELTQDAIIGFGSTNYIQIKFFYQDNGNVDNFYLTGVKNPNTVFPEYEPIEDKLFQGNKMFRVYISEKLKPNDIIYLHLQGISKQYYNYMVKILNFAGTNSINPFQTPPADIRGNIINQTNDENFPYGYFSLNEIDTKSYTIK